MTNVETTASHEIEVVDITELDSEWSTWPAISRVEAIAIHLLKGDGKTDSENYLASTILRARAKEEFPLSTKSIADNTFTAYLSQSASAPNSELFSAGKRRGYYCADQKQFLEAVEVTEPTEPESQAVPSKRIEREKLIYPVVESWLISAGNQAADVSSFKKNGKWGNPDVMGLKIFDTFDGTAIEITSIEVKTSELNWEQFIFEAISHRRFANRSYFSFLHPDSLISKLDKQNFQYYCELFKVGIVVVAVDDAKFKEILEGENPSDLATDDVEIIELIPAPHNIVPHEKQYRFLQNIGIDGKKKLMQFGLSNSSA